MTLIKEKPITINLNAEDVTGYEPGTVAKPMPTVMQQSDKNNLQSIVRLDNTGKPDLSKYSAAEIAEYRKHAAALTTAEPNSILNFGLELQNKLAGYSDQFLTNIRVFDAGAIGSSINDLLNEVNYIDIDPSQQSGLKRFLSKIPGLKKIVMNTKQIFSRYDSVSKNIDGIVKKLDEGRLTIIKDNNQLQSLFNQNVEYIKQLEELILAGHIRYDELLAEVNDMEANRENYQDYEIADKRDFVQRLEKRLSDMAITRVITIQSLPQIRLVQNNNNTMVEKIQSSVVTTIPIWKNQLSIAVTLMRQQNMLAINNKMYETTNVILKKNSEMLKSNSIDVANQNERSVVSIDTLKQVNSDLISTIQEIKKIQEQGTTQRAVVARELEALEKDLKGQVLGTGSSQLVGAGS